MPDAPMTTPLPDAGHNVRWRRIGAVPRLAVRPAGVLLGCVAVLLVALVAQAPRLWLPPGDLGPAVLVADRATDAVDTIKRGVVELHPQSIGTGLQMLVVAIPGNVVSRYPASTWAVLVPAAIVLALFGGAIARLAAIDFVRHPALTWPKAVAFSLRRGFGFASAALAPAVVAAITIGVVAILGFLLWKVPVIQVVAGVAFPLYLALGGLVVLLTVGQALGLPMFVPALACEGSDAIDAVQRVYAYVVARPLRALLASLALLGQLILLVSVAQWLADAAVRTTLDATAALAAAPHDWITATANGSPAAPIPAGASGSLRATLSLVGLWCKLPAVLVAGLGVSAFFSGGTVLYLLLRHDCDGQDPAELWHPGRIAGVARIDDSADPGEAEL